MEPLSERLRLSLEDLASDMAHARRSEQLGRLALLCYCEVRPWARSADEPRLADKAGALTTRSVPGSRTAFLGRIDALIIELEGACVRAGLEEEAAALMLARAAG
ncbi:hypothetical protein [Variovorax sp. OV329]|uniref:hypothetical protein n=1 Tax=Variovorax sp. OV329 TaxID=1882825 RepID=UPI001113EC94|nr:hypothetical protein [Variovorax sp. OV329]